MNFENHAYNNDAGGNEITCEMASFQSSEPRKAQKRKRNVLTIEQKLDIFKLIATGTSYTLISERYGIGRSTVVDIKKNQNKLEGFSKKMVDMGMKKAKTMKIGEYQKLDEALYIWFRQQREKGMPVTGPILTEKARLFPLLYPNEID